MRARYSGERCHSRSEIREPVAVAREDLAELVLVEAEQKSSHLSERYPPRSQPNNSQPV